MKGVAMLEKLVVAQVEAYKCLSVWEPLEKYTKAGWRIKSVSPPVFGVVENFHSCVFIVVLEQEAAQLDMQRRRDANR
jgi:hypothetical protein